MSERDFDQLFALLILTIGVCSGAVIWQLVKIEDAIKALRSEPAGKETK